MLESRKDGFTKAFITDGTQEYLLRMHHRHAGYQNGKNNFKQTVTIFGNEMVNVLPFKTMVFSCKHFVPKAPHQESREKQRNTTKALACKSYKKTPTRRHIKYRLQSITSIEQLAKFPKVLVGWSKVD